MWEEIEPQSYEIDSRGGRRPHVASLLILGNIALEINISSFADPH